MVSIIRQPRTDVESQNGIIPISAFNGNTPVQLLAFTCAAAGAAIWVMWCTRHNAHVSSTYSLVSSIAGVGVATVGVKGVQWGWNGMYKDTPLTTLAQAVHRLQGFA